MAAPWARLRRSISQKLCLRPAATLDDAPPPAGRRTPATAASGRVSSSSMRNCAVCLSVMAPGLGEAIFTAECSHQFHYQCISSNVKHGNYTCPVCRAKWKDVPTVGSHHADSTHNRSRVIPIVWPQDVAGSTMAVMRRVPYIRPMDRPTHLLHYPTEPSNYDDDEPVNFQQQASDELPVGVAATVQIEIHPDLPAIQDSDSWDDFSILIRVKAPNSSATSSANSSASTRAPLDLVTVLDVSGSMAGTKLALLKRAMSFVIQNLGPNDRLSVIVFSSSAHRLFHLRRMTDSGRNQALQAVNTLMASGGTNIAEGLKKAAKVIEERRMKNPICNIILLSDGQDTYSIIAGTTRPRDYSLLVPLSILQGGAGQRAPIHTFGFGTDHDSSAMHSIAEASRGTFSFIEAEGTIQDAFAQCIGGLLSVVVQELHLSLECVDEGVLLLSVHAGNYASWVSPDCRSASVEVGDLYANEQRGFLASVHIPPSRGETLLLKVAGNYMDPIRRENVQLQDELIQIERPESVPLNMPMSLEVDRERNRIHSAKDMSAARVMAETGDLTQAVSILEARRGLLSRSLAWSAGDGLSLSLDSEMREMQERMQSRQRYEESGRAFMLSGLSSHSWQRATTRGSREYTESTSIHSYLTPSMVDMLQRSQTFCTVRQASAVVKPTKSFSGRLHQR